MDAINCQLAKRSLFFPVTRLRKMLVKAKNRTACPDAQRSFEKIGDALEWIDRYADVGDWREVENEVLRIDEAMAELSSDIRFMHNWAKKDNARKYHDRAKAVVEAIRRVVFVEVLRL